MCRVYQKGESCYTRLCYRAGAHKGRHMPGDLLRTHSGRRRHADFRALGLTRGRTAKSKSSAKDPKCCPECGGGPDPWGDCIRCGLRGSRW